jgi:hypothetical protein
MRLALLFFALFVAIAGAVGFSGCLGDAPSSAQAVGGNGATQDNIDAGVGSVVDLAGGPDLSPHPLPLDLGSTDLAGLVNCFGATVCDPNQSFCIRLHSGSATNPGTTQTPACYEPVDCMGANMNCDCITQDPVLGGSCVNCVDNQDNTYDCYAQQ